jgi:NADPH:quinone reductase-like Zn-dependent oxidoreductase
MKAAVVRTAEHPPVFGEYPDPAEVQGEVIVKVAASALSHLTRSRAAGKHYSSTADVNLVPGVDGVGRLPDGRRVYFIFPSAPFGAMGQLSRVKENQCVSIPDEVDDVTMAAIAIPAMSSWAALTERAKILPGETVLINGATGTAGKLAVQIAKWLSAGKVIATGRNGSELASLTKFGADVLISLQQSDQDFASSLRSETKDVGVVLDYRWGRSAEQIIATLAGRENEGFGERTRFVQVGSISGPDISLPSAVFRSSGLEILGSGYGSLSSHDMVKVIAAAALAIVPAHLHIETDAVPLEDIEATWNRTDPHRRRVYVL